MPHPGAQNLAPSRCATDNYYWLCERQNIFQALKLCLNRLICRALLNELN